VTLTGDPRPELGALARRGRALHRRRDRRRRKKHEVPANVFRVVHPPESFLLLARFPHILVISRLLVLCLFLPVST